MARLQEARNAAALMRELAQALVAVRRKAAFHTPAPPESGFVLDVGGGNDPHPRADLVVDKYVADSFERGGGLDVRKALVVADGEALPFADGSFSYVIASHVLEHAISPSVFAGELTRVGTAGFVQVPSRQAELTFGWPFHPWLIDEEDGQLVFRPRGNAAAPIGQLFHVAMAESNLFRLWFGAHREVWHHSIHWTGSFPVRVEGESRAPRSAELDVEMTVSALSGGVGQGPQGALRKALCCPHDHGALGDHGGRLVCSECDRSYPVAGGVPILLAEAAA